MHPPFLHYSLTCRNFYPPGVNRIAAIFLFLCLWAPFAGTWLGLHWQIRTVRKEVKRNLIAGLDKNELVLLKFSKAETITALRWEHEREFEFQGQMYDIVERQTIGDTVFFRCWWDHAETRLNAQLAGLIKGALGNDPQKKECENRLQHFLRNLFPPDAVTCFTVFYPDSVSVIGIYLPFFSFLPHAPPTPPPEMV